MQPELPVREVIQQHGGLSPDARVMMLYEANKKSDIVAYLLWLTLGWFGAHNFYLRRIGVGVAQLLLTISFLGFVITFFWWIVDAFLIPRWVRNQNNMLAAQLGA